MRGVKIGNTILAACSINSRCRVVSILGGREMRSRLTDLGIVPGEELKIIRGNRNSPFVVQVRGGKVMLGRGMLEKIEVELV
ncbi:MAG: ferrous iron transport protein A [Spirochaetales bacterium]|nr:ferrous iron transport protein A [Spirochaetales bacterium]